MSGDRAPGILPLSATDQAYSRIYQNNWNTPWGVIGGPASWWGGGTGHLPYGPPQAVRREETGPNRPRDMAASVIPYQANNIYAAIGITPQQWDTYRGFGGQLESTDNYGALPNGDHHAPAELQGQTRQGYMGMYQMGAGEIIAAARALGRPPPSQRDFLNNPQLQEQLFEAYTIGHHQELMGIPQYANGDPVTRLALLWGSHLGGLPGVRAWESGSYYGPDANGTTVTSYIDRMYGRLGGQGKLTPQGLGGGVPRQTSSLAGRQYAQAGTSDIPYDAGLDTLAPTQPFASGPLQGQALAQRSGGTAPQGGAQSGPGTASQPSAGPEADLYQPLPITPVAPAQLDPLPGPSPGVADARRRLAAAGQPTAPDQPLPEDQPSEAQPQQQSELGPPPGFGPVQTLATAPAAGAPGGGGPYQSEKNFITPPGVPDTLGHEGGPGGAAQPGPPEPAETEPAPAEPTPAPTPAGPDSRYHGVAGMEKTLTPQGGINWGRVSNSADRPLETMPIAQVAELPEGEDFGGMAIHRSDLLPVANALGLDANTTKFTPDVQKAMADYVLNRDGPSYWHGSAANPRMVDQVHGLIFAATQTGQEHIRLLEADRVRLNDAVVKSNQALSDAITQGKFDSPYWRQQQREAFENQKAYERAYRNIMLNPPNRTADDLAQGMGAMTGAAGLIAGVISFLPMVASMDGLAAAISARTARNDLDYEQAMERYKTSATLAANGMRLEAQLYGEALQGRQFDMNATLRKLQAHAEIVKNTHMMTLIDQQNFEDIVGLPQKLLDIANNFEAWKNAHVILEGVNYAIQKDLDEAYKDPRNTAAIAANGGRLPWSIEYPIRQKHMAEAQLLLGQLGGKGAAGVKPKEGNFTWIKPDGQRDHGFAIMTPGMGLVDPTTNSVIPIKPGTIPQETSIGAPGALEPYTGPMIWEGSPRTPPPNDPDISNPTVWRMGLTWAETQKPPGPLGRQSQLLPAIQKAKQVAEDVLGIDPARQEIKFRAQEAAEVAIARYFSSGQGAAQMRSLNTVAEHLKLFNEYAIALQTGPLIRQNQLLQRFGIEMGRPEVTDFNAAKTLMADEVIRLLTTTGGTRGDRDDAQHLAASYHAKEQLLGVSETLRGMVYGRFDSIEKQYVSVLGGGATDAEKTQRAKDFRDALVPDALEILNTPPRGPRQQPTAGPLPEGVPQGSTLGGLDPATGRPVYITPDGRKLRVDP